MSSSQIGVITFSESDFGDGVQRDYLNIVSVTMSQLPDPKCQKCHQREATLNMLPEGGPAGYLMSHGMYQRWCKRCHLVSCIAHAEERVRDLPELRAQLAEFDAVELRAAAEAQKG